MDHTPPFWNVYYVYLAMAMAMTVPVIRPGYAIGATFTKNVVFKNNVLDAFWAFLDLLDLKNGSSSKFQVELCYREVSNPIFTRFHKKTYTFCLVDTTEQRRHKNNSLARGRADIETACILHILGGLREDFFFRTDIK